MFVKLATVCLLLAVFVVAGSTIQTASADAALIVTTTADEDIDNGDCSLREAIIAANTDANYNGCTATGSYGADTITFSVSGTIVLTGGELPGIASAITIDGAGAITLDANSDTTDPEGESRHLTVDDIDGAALTVRGLTFINGYDSYDGGGSINSQGRPLTIENSVFRDNYSQDSGGAIDMDTFDADEGEINVAPLIVSNSQFIDNSSVFTGGAIDADVSQLTVTDSQFTGNTSGESGGALYIDIDGPGTATLTNVTATGNTAEEQGGAISFEDGIATVTGLIATGNEAQTGGGIFIDDTAVTMTASDVSSNTGTGIYLVGEGNPSSLVLSATTVTFNTIDGIHAAVCNYGSEDTGSLTLTVSDGSVISDNGDNGIEAPTIWVVNDYPNGDNPSDGCGPGPITIDVSNSTIARNASTGIYPSIDGVIGTLDVTASQIVDNGGNGISTQGFFYDPDGPSGPDDPVPGTLTTTITDSAITGNGAGGLWNSTVGGSSDVTITGSNISGNAFGLFNLAGSNAPSTTIDIINSTISGNADEGVANSAFGSQATVTLTHVTVAGHGGPALWAATLGDASTIEVTNSIIANTDGANCEVASGTITGSSSISDDTSCSAGFTQVDDAGLDALADNGGTTTLPDGSHTLTHQLLPTSPAIDTADNAICAADPVNNLDQRSETRPVNASGIPVATCDIGALELQQYIGPDLALTKTVDLAEAAQGDLLTYTLTVVNNGSLPAESVTFSDPLPAGTTFISASPNCIYDPGTHTVLCGIGPGSATITVMVDEDVADGTVLINEATVTSEATEPTGVLDDNTASATTTVWTPQDLSVTKTVASSSRQPLDIVRYNINVRNTAPDGQADHVVLVDTLPANTRYAGVEAPNGWDCTVSGQTITCTTDAMQPNRTAKFVVRVQINRDATGQVVNTVNVSSDDVDPYTGDNRATARFNVSGSGGGLPWYLPWPW